ncbi:tRNA (guanosine(37)-N1)-methyltransferase TrmD [Lactobacillus sp. AN1001]|jgi:tRNA (guanine37-N1)-methyltransferase|uniref:tRNA (guanine-N(1)-)-methyltransferase n=3 Tax=Ligilactobacillus TaxID=2767887 RepID=A0AAJ6FXA0_9LACO|nr:MULTISPECIES: tRNA (guanosine(37)-N1)-methyltransferase TrmD [Ligilactobacillus]GFI63866.1 tRNA (guanine-N(1)-)-methyltransferase [Lactobacillaceae bacterium]HAP23431.1 tRNA (guanosine(37)-N1)-methyltransferase TrmD [Lactobacillus sp.]AWZ38180.1 tRNA (guanosine(37)-N1)-methyltransferase TrmD [Ligilactobacillus murinus]AWZ40833.1 tRNA (guanosine(37)-N1)-methyltransferase TrmD [Ligilactobacillus murinus]KDA46089.1 tRNA (guanine(37)-N(1))-methyltransferase, trmD [Ligilactobacillus animalis]
MKIDILSLFPEMFKGPLTQSIVGKAIEKQLLDVEVTDFRDYTTNKQRHVDDTPYGGGAGMLLQAQPIYDALDAIAAKNDGLGKVILLDPAGRKFDQKVAEELSQEKHLTFICGHYEGYDERIRERVTDEISLGDFVLTGGELGAMVVIDATVRLLPDVLGNRESALGDSFSMGLLEYPQYTRPADFRGMKVPEVLTSGNHQKIAEWRNKEALRRTYERRPDLLENYELSAQEEKWLREFKTLEVNDDE